MWYIIMVGIMISVNGCEVGVQTDFALCMEKMLYGREHSASEKERVTAVTTCAKLRDVPPTAAPE